MIRNVPANAGDLRDGGFNLYVRKIPWKRAWQPTPLYMPRESHGQEPGGLWSMGWQSQT